MLYTISIICHNHWGMTQKCLASVLRHAPGPERCEILVTDNGSGSPTRRGLAEMAVQDKRITILQNAKNEGVILPKNRAIERARGQFFVSLDNDCEISAKTLGSLVAPMVQDPGVIQVGRLAGFGTLAPAGVGHRGRRLDYIDGSCFAVRAEPARRLGLCDPAFVFAYCEDSDFSLRARKAGWRITVVDAGVIHHEHQTAHGTPGLDLRRYWAENHKTLAARWAGYIQTGRFGHPGEPEIPPEFGPGGETCRNSERTMAG